MSRKQNSLSPFIPLIGISLSLTATSIAANAADLPSLELDLSNTTVSGLSSGGYMATQFHLANSDWVKGIGVIGTGPYYCAEGDITVALNLCVSKIGGPISVDKLSAQATEYAASNSIPPLDNLSDSKVWVLHGTRDTTVNRPAADALVEQYSQWVEKKNVVYVADMPFAHHFPTLANGQDCALSESPFIGNCQYDAAGELLQHLKGELRPRVENPKGSLQSFDQQQLGGDAAESLGDKGYVYIPEQCNSEACDLHVSFHGCNQYADAVGIAYASETGLNNWADSNNMVVLYPQTKKSLFMPLNPQGCWDWWGYTGENYATKGAMQIQAVTNMVNALTNKNTGA